jgi:hypothetical protein
MNVNVGLGKKKTTNVGLQNIFLVFVSLEMFLFPMSFNLTGKDIDT